MRRLFSTAVLAALAFAPCAQAGWVKKYKPYIGASVQATTYNYDDFIDLGPLGFPGFVNEGDKELNENLYGFAVHAGVKPYKHFGFEMGGFYNLEADQRVSANFKTGVSTWGLTLDGLGYWSPRSWKDFDLIGTAGVTWTNFDITSVYLDNPVKFSDSEFGMRFGGGFQFAMTKEIDLRLLARYQTGDFQSIVDSAWTYSAGMSYNF